MSTFAEPRLRTRSNAASPSTPPMPPAPYPQATRSATSAFHPHQPRHRPPLPATSTWQQLVVTASSAAGTTAAVISEESMKCLKYCLSWLQYAIQHIAQQMTLLHNFLGSFGSSSHHQQQQRAQLASIKKDIVNTLRKVVDIISRYAGTSLPQQGKMAVRGFILHLPSRWAALDDIRSTATSPATSPAMRPTLIDKERDEQTAIRLLTFGQESVDMLQSVSVVFSDTVDRAELWLDRLRYVRSGGSATTTSSSMETRDNKG